MEGAFAWVGAAVEWFGRFFPRWVIVETTAGAVKFIKGSRVVALGPGLHWYWPATTEFTVYPTARQAVNLRTQTITTTDDKTIAVGGLIVYEIVDIEAIVARTYDPEETIRDIALSAIHDVVCKCAWDDLKVAQRNGELDRELRRETRKELDKYGVRILKTTLTDMAPCRVLKLMTSTSQD
jgi:regulator of protease activity HflC (stomatin/prohibitin superfamily)